MKKLIASASLAALGVVGAYAQTSDKPWSIGATLRGFYDDNINTAPSGLEQNSWGAEVGPYAALNLFLDQTTLGLSYNYQMRWFEDRPGSGSADHSHQVNGKLSHVFSENLSVDFSDSFVIAQEPEILDPTLTVTRRARGNNMRNTFESSISADFSETLGITAGYNNLWIDYEDQALEATLDRWENAGWLNLRYTFVPETVGILGYRITDVSYTADPLRTPAGATIFDPEWRDRLSHYFYAGVDHTLNQQLNVSLRGGVEYANYQNAPVGLRDDTWNPYVDANAIYTYAQGSSFQAGVRHWLTATDVSFAGARLIQDAETTMFYGSWNHMLTGKLRSSVLANYQIQRFDGTNLEDNVLVAGAQLSYDITEYLAAEAGYFFDRLDSDIPARSFTRNRVFLGIRASY